MKIKLILAIIALSATSFAVAGDDYTTVAILLSKNDKAISKVFACLKKVGIKDVAIKTTDPKPEIHVLKTQADIARNALSHSNLKIKIVTPNPAKKK